MLNVSNITKLMRESHRPQIFVRKKCQVILTTSYLDNVRQQLEQTSEILDKMTDAGDNKGKHKIKTVRDVLDSRAPGDSFDMDFHQRLAHVGDKNAPATNTADKIFGRKKPIDATSADDADNLAALQAGWNEYIESHNLIDSSKVSTLF